jgi:putative membrane protein
MLEQHSAAKKKQAALKLPTADSPLSQQLSEEASTTLADLKSKKGAEFDQAYLQAQVDGHQKVLDALQHDLRPQAQNPALQGYLAELEPKVSQHLEHARDAQRALAEHATDHDTANGKKTSSR